MSTSGGSKTLQIRYCDGNSNGTGSLLNAIYSNDSWALYEINVYVNSSNPSFDIKRINDGGIIYIDYIALSTKDNFIHSEFNTTYDNIFFGANLVYNLTILNSNTEYRIYNCSGTKNTSLIHYREHA